jgi:hypothetical protein
MLHRRVGFLVLLCAVAAMVGFGALGVGHGGLADTNLDMRFLYLAGVRWWQGLSAYVPGTLVSSNPWLAEAAAGYDFAYPPQSAPLCLLLGAWSPTGARVLMTALNVAAALALAAVSLRFAREGQPDQHAGRTDAATWAIPAIVLGNPATAFVIWAGQTTLIVTLALMLGWYYARRDRWAIGGVLLAISTIKPQVSVLVIFWLLLERRWRVLAAIALAIVALSAVPLVISGPVTLTTDWLAAAWRYRAGPYNLLGSRMVFGLGNVLYVAGIDVPLLLPAAFLIVGVLWYSLRGVPAADLLAILVGLALLFGFSHSYDIAALIPLVPAFWRHVHERAAASVVALGLMLVVTLPNSLLESHVSPLFLHLRVVALCVAVGWLMAMSTRRPVHIAVAAEQGVTSHGR